MEVVVAVAIDVVVVDAICDWHDRASWRNSWKILGSVYLRGVMCRRRGPLCKTSCMVVLIIEVAVADAVVVAFVVVVFVVVAKVVIFWVQCPAKIAIFTVSCAIVVVLMVVAAVAVAVVVVGTICGDRGGLR